MTVLRIPARHTLATLLITFAVAACGKEGQSGGAGTSAAATPPSATPAAAASGPQEPDPGRKVIVVEMLTDEQGNNIFRPAKLEAHRGDVVRYTLKSGVHNVHFLADSNAGKSGLPTASDMLQLPGQTYDLKVSLAKGHYYFQCDPHAALGMKGTLEVEDD